MMDHRSCAIPLVRRDRSMRFNRWLACLVCASCFFPNQLIQAAALPNPLRGVNYFVGENQPSYYLYPPLALDDTVVTHWPGKYDEETVENDLSQMQALGYNGVRTFVSPNPFTPVGSQRMDPRYLDNLTDFVQRARAHGLYVIIACGLIPQSYYSMVDEVCQTGSTIYDPTYSESLFEFPLGQYHIVCNSPVAGGENIIFLHKGFQYAEKRYLLDVIGGIVQRDPTLMADPAFALEPLNEPSLRSDFLPFTTTQGSLSIPMAQTRSYNLDVEDPLNERQQLADDMVAYWLEEIGAPLKTAYPDLTLITSTYTPYSGGRSEVTGFCDANGGGYTGVIDYGWLFDKRQPLRIAVLNQSPWVDVISIHASPIRIVEPVYHIDIDLKSAELDRLTINKPLIMGEFWAIKDFYYPTIEEAVTGLINHQVKSIDYGFSGWMLWSWSWGAWNAQASSGALLTALSPEFRPDPAATPDIRLLRPAGGEQWRVGQPVEIEWMSNIATAGTGLKFEIWRGDAKLADLGTDSAEGGHHVWSVIVPTLPTAANYQLRATSLTNPNLTEATPQTLWIESGTAVRTWQEYAP